jgi:hypothetical protein
MQGSLNIAVALTGLALDVQRQGSAQVACLWMAADSACYVPASSEIV